jgi:hypothetical protein
MKLISRNNNTTNIKLRIMCFIIDKKHPNKLVAKKDIKCYKVLLNGYQSPVMGFEYELNRLYTGLLGTPSYDGFYNQITLGFHSYSRKRKIPLYSKKCEKLVKCIIPKDSEYYYNHNLHEYVSNQIIISEVL